VTVTELIPDVEYTHVGVVNAWLLPGVIVPAEAPSGAVVQFTVPMEAARFATVVVAPGPMYSGVIWGHCVELSPKLMFRANALPPSGWLLRRLRRLGLPLHLL
jgi:hypothetical protein